MCSVSDSCLVGVVEEALNRTRVNCRDAAGYGWQGHREFPGIADPQNSWREFPGISEILAGIMENL